MAGIYLHAGPEIGVAWTKAFTCQWSRSIAGDPPRSAGDADATASARELLTVLSQVPNRSLKRTMSPNESSRSAATRRRDWLFLGRGINYPIALEGALKLKEISYIHAEGMPAAEMKHGPIALIDDAAGRRHCHARSRLRQDAQPGGTGQGPRRARHRAHHHRARRAATAFASCWIRRRTSSSPCRTHTRSSRRC